MYLYGVTGYPLGTDPLQARTLMYFKTRTEAGYYYWTYQPAHGYDVVRTKVDVGKDARAALLELANNPNWLQERPRMVL